MAEKERAYSWFIEKEEQSNSVVVLSSRSRIIGFVEVLLQFCFSFLSCLFSTIFLCVFLLMNFNEEYIFLFFFFFFCLSGSLLKSAPLTERTQVNSVLGQKVQKQISNKTHYN